MRGDTEVPALPAEETEVDLTDKRRATEARSEEPVRVFDLTGLDWERGTCLRTPSRVAVTRENYHVGVTNLLRSILVRSTRGLLKTPIKRSSPLISN